jgi:hypothetical protein
MHNMIPWFFYTHGFVIAEVLHYIKELYKFSHKWIKKILHSFSLGLIKFHECPTQASKFKWVSNMSSNICWIFCHNINIVIIFTSRGHYYSSILFHFTVNMNIWKISLNDLLIWWHLILFHVDYLYSRLDQYLHNLISIKLYVNNILKSKNDEGHANSMEILLLFTL